MFNDYVSISNVEKKIFEEGYFIFGTQRLIKINKSIYKVQNTQFDIPNCRRPIIVCGKMEDGFNINEIISLSEKINAPILADPCSGLRYNTKHENILSFYKER